MPATSATHTEYLHAEQSGLASPNTALSYFVLLITRLTSAADYCIRLVKKGATSVSKSGRIRFVAPERLGRIGFEG